MENTKEKIMYANAFGVSNSVFETRLEFSIETPDENGEKSKEVIADIRVSPQLAKMMRDILTQSLDAYESQIGSIPSGGNITRR